MDTIHGGSLEIPEKTGIKVDPEPGFKVPDRAGADEGEGGLLDHSTGLGCQSA
jgi:hypothetical protein